MLDMERGGVAELIETGQFEEGLNLEAKLGSRGMPRNAWESISAFANTDGGLLVLGVEEASDRWRTVGVPDAERVVQDICNQFRNRGKISFATSSPNDVWTEVVGDAVLVIVRVPRAPRRHRPVFLNGDPDLAFLRNGEADTLCTPEELVRMRRDADSVRADLQVVPFLTYDDFDHEAIERYRALSRERRPSLAHHRLDGIPYLRSIEAWRADRRQGIEGPTFAGMLMFGQTDAIREVRANHVIDYRRLRASEVASRRYWDRVRWRGHLFGAWEEIFPRLIRGLPTSFRLLGPHRVDEPDGLESLREAFVNLLVHTDYEDTRDAIILHRDDGYLFENPGDSWVEPQDLGVQGRSERRNPTIAQMFDDIALADQAGSGFIRILDEWREMGFRRPTIASDSARYEFRLDLSLAGLLPAPERQWLSEIGGPWREEEELALVFAHRRGYVDNLMLRTASGQHLFDASQTLRSLRDRGLLVLQGAGKHSSYVLGPGAMPLDPAQSSGHLDPSSGHLRSDVPDSNQGEDVVGEDWTRLQAIARPVAQSRKAGLATVEDTIVRLCADSARSTEELGLLLNRDAKTVRRHLARLIQEKRIKPVFAQPTHPNQRYIVPEEETTD